MTTSNMPSDTPPELLPLPGWVSLEPVLTLHSNKTFVRRDGSSDRYRVRYYRREVDNALVGRITFGRGCQGPPGHAHGGSMAALLDDAMGLSAWVAGHAVVAAEIKIQFRTMLPLDTTVTLEAWVTSAKGKKVHAKGHLLDADGKPYATGEGLFIHIGMEKFQKMFERYAANK